MRSPDGAPPSKPTTVVRGRAGDELDLECRAFAANPKAKLSWVVDGKKLEVPGHQTDERNPTDGGWDSKLRLRLPVSRDDNDGKVVCMAEHDAINFREPPVETAVRLEIFYSPRATLQINPATLLTEDRPVSVGSRVEMTCVVDANPRPRSVTWRRLVPRIVGGLGREGESGYEVVSRSAEFVVESVSRDSVGVYECVAENEVGMSQPVAVDLQVECKYILGLNLLL